MPWKCYLCRIDLADDVERCECGSIRPREPGKPRPASTSLAGPTPTEVHAQVPVARRCPGCGSERYRRVNPRARVAFAKDRICQECQTRYAPPTPVWGSIVFILAGGLLGIVMAIGLLGRFMFANPCGIPALIVQALLGVMGLLAVLHGFRTLMNRPQDAVTETPSKPSPAS